LPLGPPGSLALEWGGALRWWVTDAPASEVLAYADRVDGIAQKAWSSPAFSTPYMVRLKQAFDPHDVLNSGLVNADAAA
jgi:FAD/FMN-containing dehydrogenase